MVASATTYVMLYRAGILSWMSMLPATARSLSMERLSKLAVRWLKILDSIIDSLPLVIAPLLLFGLITGLSVGTWKLATSDLSIAAKASIAVAVIWLPFLVFLIGGAYFFLLRRRKSSELMMDMYWHPDGERPGLHNNMRPWDSHREY